MNLHEYQGKEILNKYGVKIQRGIVASTAEEAVDAAKKMTELTGNQGWVVKAQVHAGGRGKGGGVKFSPTIEKLKENAENIIGMQLVTPQTSAEGKKVHQVLIAEDVYYPGESETEEFYVSILLNRAKGVNMIMYSTEGGMEIEVVAHDHPEKILQEPFDVEAGLLPYQARNVAYRLGLDGTSIRAAEKLFRQVCQFFVDNDCSMVEINPLVVTADGDLVVGDAKVTFDDNALFRHQDLVALRDLNEEEPMEVQAQASGLSYVKLDGNLGCLVNGAGLAMSTTKRTTATTTAPIDRLLHRWIVYWELSLTGATRPFYRLKKRRRGAGTYRRATSTSRKTPCPASRKPADEPGRRASGQCRGRRRPGASPTASRCRRSPPPRRRR